MNQVEWYQVLIEPWAQVTLALTVVGYIIKTILESRNKRLEIKYSLFAQRKIDAIVNFYSAYNQFMDVFKRVVGTMTALGQFPIDQATQVLHTLAVNYDSPFYQLTFFLDDEELVPFESINRNLNLIRHKLSDITRSCNQGPQMN